MNKHTCNHGNQYKDEHPDAKQVALCVAIQAGLDSGPAEHFDFDEFVSSKERYAANYDFRE